MVNYTYHIFILEVKLHFRITIPSGCQSTEKHYIGEQVISYQFLKAFPHKV